MRPKPDLPFKALLRICRINREGGMKQWIRRGRGGEDVCTEEIGGNQGSPSPKEEVLDIFKENKFYSSDSSSSPKKEVRDLLFIFAS